MMGQEVFTLVYTELTVADKSYQLATKENQLGELADVLLTFLGTIMETGSQMPLTVCSL